MNTLRQRPPILLRCATTLLLISMFCGWEIPGARAQDTQKQLQARAQATLQIPVGTILPVRLDKELSSQKNRSGDLITAKVVQDVPLPNGQKIKAGTKVTGEIVEATPASASAGGTLSVRFDKLEIGHQEISIRTNLRALAAWFEVYNATLAEVPQDYGTSDNWATTRQVGGDLVYGYRGPVVNAEGETVGTSVNNGVLGQARAEEGTKCHGEVADNNAPQALWVFSADACGLYGFPNIQIQHAGRTEPVGEVRLATSQGNVKIHGASGMLLRVVSSGPA